MYKNLVEFGGLKGFHDILDTDYQPKLDCYVDKIWNEINNNFEYKEFIQNPSEHKYGIGVLKV